MTSPLVFCGQTAAMAGTAAASGPGQRILPCRNESERIRLYVPPGPWFQMIRGSLPIFSPSFPQVRASLFLPPFHILSFGASLCMVIVSEATSTNSHSTTICEHFKNCLVLKKWFFNFECIHFLPFLFYAFFPFWQVHVFSHFYVLFELFVYFAIAYA